LVFNGGIGHTGLPNGPRSLLLCGV
jgi:hypothetical protein